MEDLIKALQIFLKYTDTKYPTGCVHDCLYVSVSPKVVSEEDKEILNKLGFKENHEEDCFYSFKFGSY